MTTDKPTPELPELVEAIDWLMNTTFANAYGDKRDGEKMIDRIVLASQKLLATCNTRPAELRQAGMDKLNATYRERMIVVCMLAKLSGFNYGVGKDDNETWDDEWRNVVYIDLPQGQISWHIAPTDMDLFEGFPAYAGKCDGTFNGKDAEFAKALQPAAQKTDVGATSMQILEVGKDQYGDPLTVMGKPNAVHALQTALASRASVDVWQDIETAPKDECVVIKNQYFSGVAFFDTADHDWFFPKNKSEDYLRVQPKPTHWQPLPAAKFPELVGGRDGE